MKHVFYSTSFIILSSVWCCSRYKAYKRMITNCRRKCRTKAAGSALIFAEDIEDLHFYEKKVGETLCLLTCNQEYREIVGSKALKMLPRETEQKLLRNNVYEYLHICYYQVTTKKLLKIISWFNIPFSLVLHKIIIESRKKY